MNQYHYQGILGVYTCSACNQSHNFSEKNNIEKVRRFLCPHFNWVLSMIRSMNGIKMQVSSSCNLCYKQYSSELKIGSKNFNNQLNTEDTYLSMCCGNRLEVVISLSEEYFDQNESTDVHYDIYSGNNNQNNNQNNQINNNRINNNFNQNNNNIIINNNNNNNQFNQMQMMMNNAINMNQMIMNNNANNMEYMNKLDSSNIIQLNQKNKLINFLEESSNKNYKIYTSPKLQLRTVMNDLLNLYPEINYFNNNLMLNNQTILYLNYTIETLNLNDNSIIVIKNNIN